MKKLNFKAEEINTRLYNVEILEKLTAALQLSVDQASKNATIAINTAETAEKTAIAAEKTAKTAASTAEVARLTADVANATSKIAEITKDVTLLTADVAEKTSKTAISTAITAEFVAKTGMSVAQVGEETAKVAGIAADVVELQSNMTQVMADIGDENAGMMKDMADMANELSDLAQEVKDIVEGEGLDGSGLQDNLNRIEKLANDAQAHSEEVEKLANEGKGIAEEAKGKAGDAQSTADGAETHAQQGIRDAAAAQKSATDAQESADAAAKAAGQAEGKAKEAADLATDANNAATKARNEAQNAQNFATEAQDAAKKARAAADLAQLTADNKNSTFKGATDPVDAYNNAVMAYLADKTSVNLEIIPAYPKVGDLWYEPTGEDTPDKVWQLSTAYLNIAEEVKDENNNKINVLYLIYKGADFTELGGIWTDVMANTITTGFVNALGITAKKIEVKDSNDKTILLADANDNATNKVIIGGFGVKNNALHSGLIDSMNAILADDAEGVYLGTDGLRVGNKFKVTPDGTVYSSEFKLSQEEIDKLALKVKEILYAKNDSGTVPPEEGWAETLPDAEAGEYVWTKYVYQDLDEDDSNNQYSYQVYRQPENGTSGKDGQDGKDGKDGADGLTPYIKNGYWWLGDNNTWVMAEPISYSISKNMEFHNGSEQTENLQFIAQKQIGKNEREPNTDVIFRYKFTDESDYTEPIEVNSDGILVLSSSLFLNKNRQDLTVSIGHLDNGNFVEDDVEIINYISKSGYAVVLDNDVASLVYNSDGTEKLDNAQSVTATASLYENNKLVSYSTSMHLYYEWTLDGLTGNISSTKLTGNNDTITITAIDADRDFGTATCIATWEGSPQPHKAVTFKVNKNRQGNPGYTPIKGVDYFDGKDGTSISAVTEYYLATTLSTGVTTSTSGWTDTVQNVDATKKYLWNYEVIKDSKGNIINSTNPCIIGAYGDKGSTGKGISSITNYYLVSANNTGISNTSGDWKTTPQTTDATNKYLWNYELITYTDGATTETTPCIIGTHGETGAAGKDGSDGKDGTSITIKSIQYQAGTSGTTKPTSTWSNEPVVVGKGGYLWTKTTYSDNSEVFTSAYQGNDGTNGTSVGVSKIEYTVKDSNSTPTSGWSTTYPTSIPIGSYLWTKTTYTDNKAVFTSAYQGIDGADATSYWLSTSALIHRGLLQENDITITAYKKVGSQAETIDTSATIWVNDVNKGTGSVTITASTIKSTYKDTDLTIVAKHNNVEFDKEIIEKALNTYVLALSNDSSTIKTGETATSNAIVYMDGVDVSSGSSPLETVIFNWTAVGSTSSLSNTSSISINANSISGTKTYNCQATVNGTTLNKQFTITKVSDGTNGTSAGNIYALNNSSTKWPGYGTNGTKPTISSSEWTKAPQEPTAANNYCWVCAYTVDANGTYTYETPIIHASYEGMISLLSDDGLKIISKDGDTGEYYVNTDHINGALSDKVTVGGFNVNNQSLYSSGYISSYGDNTSSEGVYLGKDGIKLGANFSVSKTGSITAKDGTIGGFKIGTNSITNGTVTKFNDKSNPGVYLGADGISLGKGAINLSADGIANITSGVLGKGKAFGTGNKFKETINVQIDSSSAEYTDSLCVGPSYWSGAWESWVYNFTDLKHDTYTLSYDSERTSMLEHNLTDMTNRYIKPGSSIAAIAYSCNIELSDEFPVPAVLVAVLSASANSSDITKNITLEYSYFQNIGYNNGTYESRIEKNIKLSWQDTPTTALIALESNFILKDTDSEGLPIVYGGLGNMNSGILQVGGLYTYDGTKKWSITPWPNLVGNTCYLIEDPEGTWDLKAGNVYYQGEGPKPIEDKNIGIPLGSRVNLVFEVGIPSVTGYPVPNKIISNYPSVELGASNTFGFFKNSLNFTVKSNSEIEIDGYVNNNFGVDAKNLPVSAIIIPVNGGWNGGLGDYQISNASSSSISNNKYSAIVGLCDKSIYFVVFGLQPLKDTGFSLAPEFSFTNSLLTNATLTKISSFENSMKDADLVQLINIFGKPWLYKLTFTDTALANAGTSISSDIDLTYNFNGISYSSTTASVSFSNSSSVTKYTFTVSPTPSTATVYINGVQTKSVQVAAGTTISYKVTCSGYEDYTKSIVMTASNKTEYPTLTKKITYYEVTAEYVTTSGTSISPNVTESVAANSSYNLNRLFGPIDGYTINAVKVNGAGSYTITDNINISSDTTITYVYKIVNNGGSD